MGIVRIRLHLNTIDIQCPPYDYYRPKPKPEKRNHWGKKLLAGMALKGKPTKKQSPGQMKLPWDDWVADNPEICRVAEQFVLANCYDPRLASIVLQKNRGGGVEEPCQVSESGNPHGFVENDLEINLYENL